MMNVNSIDSVENTTENTMIHTNVSFNVFQTNQFKTNTGQNGTVANLDMTIKL